MEKTVTQSLKKRMNEISFTQEEATHLVYSILSDLEELHQSNRAFGTLTPDFITDKGIVIKEDLPTVEESKNLSTPYTSPALQRTSKAYPQCDIHSIGIIFYELLTGQLPPKPYLPPSRLKPVLPEIDNFISKAIHKHPDYQHETPHDVSREIKKIINKLKPQKVMTPINLNNLQGAPLPSSLTPPAKKKKSFLASLLPKRNAS